MHSRRIEPRPLKNPAFAKFSQIPCKILRLRMNTCSAQEVLAGAVWPEPRLVAFSFFGLLIAPGCAAAVFGLAALSFFLGLCGRMHDRIGMARLSEQLRDR